ncbi:hypothetical protein [Ideonella sp.]|uniref:hypothetical protein n=1 Tax=Ideonella sp. TaxID=1929293 RepID=UPI0035B087F3
MIAALFATAGFTGCATYELTKPAPAQSAPVAVTLSQEELSGWSDLPIGTYRVPDSHVIISGHQKGHGAAAAFGLLGMAVAHAANQSAGESAVKGVESTLKIKLDGPLMASVRQAVAEESLRGGFTADAGTGTQLVVTPGLVLTYVSDNDVRPFIVLKAALLGADKKPLWNTRYIVSTGISRPLAGDNSWTDNGGAALRENVQASIDKGVRVMLADVMKPYARDDNALSAAEGQFPFMKDRFQLTGYKLTEDDRYFAFVPKIGDVVVFAGVNILDKQDSQVRAATKDDPVAKIVPARASVATAP